MINQYFKRSGRFRKIFKISTKTYHSDDFLDRFSSFSSCSSPGAERSDLTKKAQARRAPVDAFFVKSDYSVPGDVHSAYNHTHFASVWQHFANYFDNSYMSYTSYVLQDSVLQLDHTKDTLRSRRTKKTNVVDST